MGNANMNTTEAIAWLGRPALRDLVAALTQINTELTAANAALMVRVETARRLLGLWSSISDHCEISDNVCCCGDDMINHADPMSCGHSPCDSGGYAAMTASGQTREWLAGGAE